MGFFDTLKDRVYDKFGILDDAQDFFDRLEAKKRDFRVKGAALTKVVEDIKQQIEDTDDPERFDQARYRQALKFIEDLSDDMRDLLKDVVDLERKARRDKKIWNKVQEKITTTKRKMQDAYQRSTRLESDLDALRRQHIQYLKELEKQNEASGAKDRAISNAAKLLGGVAGLVAALLVAA